jgi:hypothetical protein
MNSDTADAAVQAVYPTIVNTAGELAAPPPSRGAGIAGSSSGVRGWWALMRADSARMSAVRDSWRALWWSRVLVWATALATLLTLGFGPVRGAFNPPGVTHGFGWLGDLLAAVVARWDAAWYLVIAHYGYRPDLGVYTASRAAFFPLYPLALRGVSTLGAPPIAAGVLVSVAALALALYGIHRLTTLELGRALAGDRLAAAARLAVMLTAFAPMAFFFSAVYSESLYLALSVGLFWSARHGRWALVGVLGALASATRSTGLVLALPALIIYLYGPREDRVADFVCAGWRRLLPRFRVRRDLLWLGAIALGVVLYGLYLALLGGDALEPLRAEGVWGRHFAGPYVGVWDGIKAAFAGARQLLSGQRRHVYFPIAAGDPFVSAEHNLMLLAFMAAAIPAVVGVVRRLPLAYGAYVIAALTLPLSDPVSAQPLMSLPRFLLVLFPLSIWLAAWLTEHPRAQRPALLCSGALLVFFGAQFATWHWVA